MLGFLAICLPIFAVVFIGLGAARARLVTPANVDAVGLFAFNVALPAMLLRLMAAQPLAESFKPDYFLGYLGACLAVFFGVTLIAKARPHDRQRAAALGAAAAMGNVGYLAPPLLLPILGERIAGPVAMAIVAEVAVIIAIGSVLMSRAAACGARWRTSWIAVRGLARNPVILSVAAGAMLAATGSGIPPFLDRFLAFLGGAAGPTALFALGGTLGRLAVRRDLVLVSAGVAFAKLVAYPVLVWAILDPVLGLERFWVMAGILLAAMPTATNAFVLAQRNGAGAEEVSAAVMLSTLLAAILFPVTAWLISAPVVVP
ncbi:MAG TPA: AEC family transporter [Acetobacteraceae bacterium]|nr:AEC family transporter [Acetobacteraceae bacterium]